MYRLLPLTILAFLGACGRAPEAPPGPPPAPTFQPDALGSGAALYVRAQLNASEVRAEVLGRGLGSVLGYAFRLEWEGLAEPASGEAVEVLGTPAPGEASYLLRTSPRALVVGGARHGSAAGERDVATDTVLARVTLKRAGDVARLRLADASVRRADGSGVMVALAGGRIGGAP